MQSWEFVQSKTKGFTATMAEQPAVQLASIIKSRNHFHSKEATTYLSYVGSHSYMRKKKTERAEICMQEMAL